MCFLYIKQFAFFICFANAAFNALKGYDDLTSYAFGTSKACVQALNKTVDCHESTANMAAAGMDENYWYQNNLTDLCSSQCKHSVQSWLNTVETECAAETITQSGVVVKAKTIPLQYSYGYDLACLQDSAGGWCFLESQQWSGNDYIRNDPNMCVGDDPPEVCLDEDFDVETADPALQSITGLYSKSLFCNECFLNMWRQRLLSPFLLADNWTDYRIDAFETLQKNCSTSMDYTTSASTLFVGTPDVTLQPTAISGAPPVVTGANITVTCTGRVVQPLQAYLTCNEISDQFLVSTGDLRVATNDTHCNFEKAICLPLACVLKNIDDYGQTCASIASSISNSSRIVTEEQFFGWNQNIQGSCDDLAMNQRICVSPPGGHWSTNTSIIGPPSSGSYYTTAIPVWPTQSGSATSCGRYHQVINGDTCNLVCLLAGITLATLRRLNAYLNADCTNLWLKTSICTGEVLPAPVTTNGLCGPGNDYAICDGTEFGTCCSMHGYCGNGSDYCSPGNCYSGNCFGPPTSTSNGTCGPDWGGLTCDHPEFGPCCSIYGSCGSSEDYCGPGNCYSGKCDPDIGGSSINGECGPLFQGNKTCTGTHFGVCCSQYGYCGDGEDFCKGSNCYSGACTE